MPSSHAPVKPDEKVAEFWDEMYAAFDPTATVSGALELPDDAPRLGGKSILIVACGTGAEVVRACREAAAVTAIDISQKAVENARAMVAHNGQSAEFVVADAGQSGLPSGSFDVIWGSAVLHHLEHAAVAREFARLLKPDGVVYMIAEPTFFNPLLKFAYETAFGRGRVGRRRRFLIFVRKGDEFEKPIEHSDLALWQDGFHVATRSRNFMFIEKIGHVLSPNRKVHNVFSAFDRGLTRLLPPLKRYGYEHDIILRKKG
ncbi:MAG: class I SAM-dependent methyltransferase [Sphingomonas sp.]